MDTRPPDRATVTDIVYVPLETPLLAAASFLPSFQRTYPLYSDAGDSLTHFVLYQIPYGMRFASVEAFFRGFLMLKRMADGDNQATVGRALTHIFGGAAAINVNATAAMLAATFAPTMNMPL